MLTSAFQRSGRESEISSHDNPNLYQIYQDHDIIYFKREAELRTIFSSKAEIEIFSKFIYWDSKDIIARIIHAAHILDLRRIPHFDMNRIKDDARKMLPGSELLFNQAGYYLKLTGDRNGYIGKTYFSDRFFILSQNPYNII